MSQQELLKKAIQVLNQAKIQYMITGSAASSLQGEPRSTRRHISTRTVEKVFEDTVKKGRDKERCKRAFSSGILMLHIYWKVEQIYDIHTC